MSSPNQHTAPNSEDRGAGQWPADLKRPIHTAPTPQRLVSMLPANMIPNGWMLASGSHPGFIGPGTQQHHHQQHMAGHFGMVHHQQQLDWGQYAPYIVTPPVTPPNTGAVYDAHGRSRVPPQTQAHWPQGQQQHDVYANPNHANLTHLRAQQQLEDAAMQQLCARLSLDDTEKPSVAGTAPATGPTQQVLVPAIADTTTVGAAELTVVPGTTGPKRIILGPDGAAIVPPPDPVHPGCELSVPMAEAMKKFSLDHCCDYLIAKDLLRDKIVKQVLENTKEKLMELLQNELDKMGEEDDDSDMDFDCEDEEPDWTLEG